MKTFCVLWLGLIAFVRTDEIKPLGIAIEEIDYPYPVMFMPMEIEGQTVRMAYMVANASDAPTVVLLHGKNFYGAYWEPTIKALASEFRVIIPDQIGFGKSAKPAVHYSFDLLAESTKKILDSRGIKKFAVVGHSMGGMLAVHMAAKYPEAVTHLILANPIGLEDYGQKVPHQELSSLINKEIHDTDPDHIREFFKKYVVEWKPELYERYVETRVRVTRSGEYDRWANASARTYQMILEQPVVGEFGKIKAPTLLVIGQKDRTAVGKDLVSKEVAEKMGNYPELGKKAARAIPNSKLIELPNAAHIPHLEATDEFNRLLKEFLQRP